MSATSTVTVAGWDVLMLPFLYVKCSVLGNNQLENHKQTSVKYFGKQQPQKKKIQFNE